MYIVKILYTNKVKIDLMNPHTKHTVCLLITFKNCTNT